MSSRHDNVSPGSWIDAAGALEAIDSGFLRLEKEIGRQRRGGAFTRPNPFLRLSTYAMRPKLSSNQNRVINAVTAYAKAIEPQKNSRDNATMSGLVIAYEGARLGMKKDSVRTFGEAVVTMCEYVLHDQFGPDNDSLDVYCNPVVLASIASEPYRDSYIRRHADRVKFDYAFYAVVSLAFEQLVSSQTFMETSQLPVFDGGIDFIFLQAEIAMFNQSLPLE